MQRLNLSLIWFKWCQFSSRLCAIAIGHIGLMPWGPQMRMSSHCILRMIGKDQKPRYYRPTIWCNSTCVAPILRTPAQHSNANLSSIIIFCVYTRNKILYLIIKFISAHCLCLSHSLSLRSGRVFINWSVERWQLRVPLFTVFNNQGNGLRFMSRIKLEMTTVTNFTAPPSPFAPE